MDKTKPLVAIRSITYNHALYIKQCLDGFVMQKTSFEFVAVVHDDCSTDGTTEILREYAKKYPNIIKPIYEIENQWSKHNGSLARIMNETIDSIGAKYVAMCEGDDYWTDPLKLQKQVDFLESHPEYSMCVHAAQWTIGENEEMDIVGCNYQEERDLTADEIIRQGGLYIATASTLYRTCTIPKGEDRPIWWRMADIGDYTLHIYASLHGKVHFLPEAMCVYRYQHPGSWTYNQGKTKDIKHAKCEIAWMEVLDKETQGNYFDSINNHLCSFYNLLFFEKEISVIEYYRKVCRTGVISRSKYIKRVIQRTFNHAYKVYCRIKYGK